MTEHERYWHTIDELLRGRRVGRGRPGVVERGECWCFAGAVDACGYGCIQRGGFRGRAHRYVWLEVIGPIPPNMQILHKCDNPSCVRPSHLWMGSHTDNMRDMKTKGRGNTNGLTKGTEVSRRVRMTEWTEEQRIASARHAAVTRHAGRTLARSKGKT